MQTIDLKNELQKAFDDQPWHGPSLLSVLDEVSAGVANRKIGQSHSIAEIVYHLTGWTEACTLRLYGHEAELPERGDWPLGLVVDEKSWRSLKEELISAHKKFSDKIGMMTDADWQIFIGSLNTENALGANVTIAETVSGIIQHYAYHAGQIILLVRALS